MIMLNETLKLNTKSILVTGAAGFIGANLVMKLMAEYPGARIVGLDNLNDYYDVSLKHYRLGQIEAAAGERQWEFIRGDISDKAFLENLFVRYSFDVVVNLAAQAGVRYSIDNPDVYVESNVIGFYNILECCRNHPVEHLVYASSSSVYGSNQKVPYSVNDTVDHPVSLYAATKKTNELMAHTYSKLYRIPTTGLRFFTVYGPAGRPDMAYFSFTNKLIQGDTIEIFNYGNCQRDFTYVGDIVEGVRRVMTRPPMDEVPYRIYNIGNSDPENLLNFVDILQQELIAAGVLPESYDFEAHKRLVPMQPGDVVATCADVSELIRDTGFRPQIGLREGLRRFAQWYRAFYNEKTEHSADKGICPGKLSLAEEQK